MKWTMAVIPLGKPFSAEVKPAWRRKYIILYRKQLDVIIHLTSKIVKFKHPWKWQVSVTSDHVVKITMAIITLYCYFQVVTYVFF